MGEWLRKVTTPFKRMWGAVHSVVLLRLHPHKRGQGIGKLYNEVRSCHYDDVHVMWSMLQQSRYPLGSPKRHCRIARIFE
ncbi:unnamed protein product [Sphagnum compactum]